MDLQQILAAGREILASKRNRQEDETAAERERLATAFNDARHVAVKLFAPIDEALIEPVTMPEGWRPSSRKSGGDERFSFRMIGCPRVFVWLDFHGRIDGDGLEWRQTDDRYRYRVESNFRASEDGDAAWGESYHTTDSLAEALALAEQEAPAYRECIAGRKAYLEGRKHRVNECPKQPTPAEQLLIALERWHGSLEHSNTAEESP